MLLGNALAELALRGSARRLGSAKVEAQHRDVGKRLVAIIPELDDYLRPAEAARRFASVPELEFVAVEGGKHLWVGEEQTYRVLTEIVARLNPGVLPLPREWND